MKWLSMLVVSLSFSCAQGLDPSLLLKPPTTAWPTYNGDYSRWRAIHLRSAKSIRRTFRH